MRRDRILISGLALAATISLALKATGEELLRDKKFVMPACPNPDVTAQEAPFELKPGEALDLRIYLDKSILEVFANGRQCVTQRIYPVRQDSLGVSLFSEGGEAKCISLDAWEMTPTRFTADESKYHRNASNRGMDP